MTEKQDAKFQVYLNLKSVFNKNTAKWAEGELKSSVNEFIETSNKITELKKEFDKDISDLVNEKARTREELICKATPLFNVLQVFAGDVRDRSMGKKVNYSKSKLAKLKDAELIERTKTLLKYLKQAFAKSLEDSSDVNAKTKKTVKRNITAYGITGQMIEDFETLHKKFITAILNLTDAMNFKNKCAKKITEKIKKNDKLLSKRIDKLMSLFGITDSKFYEAYEKAKVLKEEEPEKKEETVETKPKTTVKKPVKRTTTTRRTTTRKTPATGKKTNVVKAEEPKK